MNSDFTLKLAIIRLGSNSSTSLANENECFIVYLLVVIGLAGYHRTLLTCKWAWLVKTKLDESWNFILQILVNFTKSIKYP